MSEVRSASTYYNIKETYTVSEIINEIMKPPTLAEFYDFEKHARLKWKDKIDRTISNLREIRKTYGILNFEKLVEDGIMKVERFGHGGVVPLKKSKLRDSM